MGQRHDDERHHCEFNERFQMPAPLFLTHS
jgi:hypothetical protein